MTQPIDQLQDLIGHRFHDPDLLLQALTHPSWIPSHDPEAQKRAAHYERLEFLGDALLTFTLTKILFHRYPDQREGDLTRLRTLLIQGKSLSNLARQLDLGSCLRLGPSVEATNGRDHDPILENSFEALLGALLVDGGQSIAEEFITRIYGNMEERLARFGQQDNPKGRLQEFLQNDPTSPPPLYEVIATRGPDHDRIFTIRLSVAGEFLAEASGSSKRKAEEAAAALALEKLNPT